MATTAHLHGGPMDGHVAVLPGFGPAEPLRWAQEGQEAHTWTPVAWRCTRSRALPEVTACYVWDGPDYTPPAPRFARVFVSARALDDVALRPTVLELAEKDAARAIRELDPSRRVGALSWERPERHDPAIPPAEWELKGQALLVFTEEVP